MQKLKIILAPFLLLALKLNAQVSFPLGNVLNLNTSNNFLYLETRILFHTGNFKSDDYRWEKVSDSLDKRWSVTACFNGDCRNDLLQSGSFLKDFGLNDTTCFIAFHVEAYQYTGTSVIKYNVYNKKNAADSASLVFNITYTNTTSIPNAYMNEMVLYPNPVSSILNMESNINLQDAEIKITNALGETVCVQKFENPLINPIDMGELNMGIYFIQVKTKDRYLTYKITKQ